MSVNKGFTLVELVVTMAIMAIIVSMAGPSFMNTMSKQRLDSTARDLSLVFGNARSQAAALRKNITIKLEAGTNTATTYYWTSKYDSVVLTSDAVDIVFDPTGLAKQRQKMIDNDDWDEDAPTDMTTTPPTNPRQVPEIIPLEFNLCDAELGESRTVSISKIGTINKISAGTC